MRNARTALDRAAFGSGTASSTAKKPARNFLHAGDRNYCAGAYAGTHVAIVEQKPQPSRNRLDPYPAIRAVFPTNFPFLSLRLSVLSAADYLGTQSPNRDNHTRTLCPIAFWGTLKRIHQDLDEHMRRVFQNDNH